MLINDQKTALRKQLLSLRDQISKHDWKKRSQNLHERFKLTFDISSISCIHCYISMDQRNEVETLSLIREFIDSGIDVVVPITVFDTHTLMHTKITSLDDMHLNKWGVLEPNSIEEVEVNEPELIIVPLVGADRQKNRLGYGKGFYDRFLSKTKAIKVGFCFSECLVEAIPVEDFDVPLDYLITDQEVIT